MTKVLGSMVPKDDVLGWLGGWWVGTRTRAVKARGRCKMVVVDESINDYNLHRPYMSQYTYHNMHVS